MKAQRGLGETFSGENLNRNIRGELATLEWKRYLLDLENKTNNLMKMLAYSPVDAMDYQADLGIAIHLHQLIRSHALNQIEFNSGGCGGDRKAVLEAKIADWDQNWPEFKQKYEELRARLIKREQEVKKSAGTPPLDVDIQEPPSEQDSEPEPKLKPISVKGRKPSKFKACLWAKVQKVYRSDPSLEGKAFWKRVENEGGLPDPNWVANGCPRKLSDAFDDRKWRETLNREKSRATKELRN